LAQKQPGILKCFWRFVSDRKRIAGNGSSCSGMLAFQAAFLEKYWLKRKVRPQVAAASNINNHLTTKNDPFPPFK
jgi:phosphoheptose isomerase